MLRKLLCDRNVIMLLGLIIGLAWGGAASWTEPLTLPGLALVMTLSTMGISGSLFRPVGNVVNTALAGIAMSYAVFAGVILALNLLFVKDPALRTGFVLLAAVPPAVAVIPFTLFLKGNRRLFIDRHDRSLSGWARDYAPDHHLLYRRRFS